MTEPGDSAKSAYRLPFLLRAADINARPLGVASRENLATTQSTLLKSFERGIKKAPIGLNLPGLCQLCGRFGYRAFH